MNITEKIPVIIFEDNAHLRDSLYFLVNSSHDFTCLQAFPDTRNVLQNVEKYKPQVIIMDIEMPVMTGIEATSLIKRHNPEIHILILTVFDDSEKIFQSICAGGSGYLLKNSSPEQILQALMDVHKGGSPLSPSVAKRVVHFFQQANPVVTVEDFKLTSKEKELLQLMVDGGSYKMIADKMNISFETVKTHVKNIYKKLHVNSSSEAVAKAIKQRLV
ncbi:MAG TPA: response regulator transcription factor [Panacibacter sp.]|nr:response regulator transcription factor [Panacibacter sp.]HNP43863.1 response regulator transcription factor [Panacibacter sp.]